MKKYIFILAIVSVSLPLVSSALIPPGIEPEFCAIDLNFSPHVVEQGKEYTATWYSENVRPGTLEYKCSDMSSWANLGELYNWSTTYTATEIGSNTCEMRAQSAQNYMCYDEDTVQIVKPVCSASLSWSPQAVAYGGSATETWSVSGADKITGECTGIPERDLGTASFNGNYTFNNLTSNTTCTVRGYEYVNGDYVQACSASATVYVGEAPPPTTPLEIRVNAPTGISWEVVGPNTYTGTGDETIVGVPAGEYVLYVTDGWNNRVVTAITDIFDNPGQRQTLTAPPATGGTVPPVPPAPPPTFTPTYPVEPSPRRPAPTPEDGGIFHLFFKQSPSEFFSALMKKVYGAEGSITFNIRVRDSKTFYGSLSLSDTTLNTGQTYTVTGTTNDPADAYKYLSLYKGFTRISNNQTERISSHGWNGIVTDVNGNFSHTSTFGCQGGDGTTFYNSDYLDKSYVVYDQGDRTGDSSPPLISTKLCGGAFSIISKNTRAQAVPFMWDINGLYGNWSNSSPDVQYSNGAYTTRLDRVINSLSGEMPLGYTEFRAEVWVGSAGGGGIKLGTYDSWPIPFDMSPPFNAANQIRITWYEPGGTAPPPVVPPGPGVAPLCSPFTQRVQIGSDAVLYAEKGTGTYSWSAPGGNPPSSDSGDEFRTTYSTEGSYAVTVTSGGLSASCEVNVGDETGDKHLECVQNSCTVVDGPGTDQCSSAGFVCDVDPPPPSPPTVDIKAYKLGDNPANAVDNLTINDGDEAVLIWESTDAVECSAFGGYWGGTKPVFGSQNTAVLNSPPVDRGYSIRCYNDFYEAIDTATISLTSIPTVNVGLVANPSSGESPLDTDLTATVSGTATGPINYYFWWNCSSIAKTKAGVMADGCGDPANPLLGQVIPSTNENPKTVSHVYSGVVGASFSPKVVVERGVSMSSAEARTNVSITGTDFHLGCVNNSCVRVAGAGTNECSPEGSSCSPNTHLECINNSCVRVDGAGTSECSPEGSSCVPNFHLECINNSCTKVDGAGTSECSLEGSSCSTSKGACEFTANPKIINKGGTSRLEWECEEGVSACSISQGVGTVGINGQQTVKPSATTKYTLTCTTGPDERTPWDATVTVFEIDETDPQ